MAFKFSAPQRSEPVPSLEPKRQNIVAGTYTISNVRQAIPDEIEWRKTDGRFSLIVHLDGEIEKISSEFDGRQIDLDPPMPGEFWLVPAGIEYASSVTGRSARYLDLVADVTENERLDRLRPIAGGYDREIVRLSAHLITNLDTENDDLVNAEILVGMVDRVCSNYSVDDPPTIREINLAPAKIAMLEEFICDSIAERISLEQLTELADETPHRFLWAFRRAFHRTPSQYVIEKRLRRARHFLLNSEKDITSVALESGFSNHSHLSSVFKKRLGLTPSEYRLFATS